jgi:hypothetical protein
MSPCWTPSNAWTVSRSASGTAFPPVVEGLPAVRGQRSVAVTSSSWAANGYGQLTDRPLLPRSDDPGRLLPPDPGGSGAADLGRNGTYLVLRQLEQDVEGFWRYVGEATQRPDGSSDPGARAALAAKLVGRWQSGAPLVEAPDRDDPALATGNDVGDLPHRPAGNGLPARRAHPPGQSA